MLQTSDKSDAEMAEVTPKRHVAKFSLVSIDADEGVHKNIRQVLEQSRLPIELTASTARAADALDLCLKLQPDIVVLDLQMPIHSGTPLGRQMQGLLDREPLLICLTGEESFEEARKAVQLSAVDLLLKPFTDADIVKALERAVATLHSIRSHQQELLALEQKLEKSIQVSPPVARYGRTRSFQIAQAVRRYVDAHYAEDISLQSAADYVRLSASYLGPLFKAVCGVSFRAYLRMIRVAKAKELMRDPSLNLSEIAQRVGFEDENYFSHVFLEVTGTRPGQYRNRRLAHP